MCVSGNYLAAHAENNLFSWQSDIKPNRTFIETSLSQAIEELRGEDIHLEVALDRDTMGSIGTVEIANTIFEKIDISAIFVADVSIIGKTENDRKVSNPNVLTELGYAANVLGWNNIVTVFNSNYGNVEELPFDIRHRRHIVFNALPNTDNSKAKASLTKDFVSAITPIIAKEQIRKAILSHFKLKVDETVFKICSAVHYLLFGYEKTFFIDELFSLLDIDAKTIEVRLSKKILGFAVFKEIGIYRQEIEKAYENPKYSKFLNDKQLLNFIEISHCLETLERLLIIDNSKSETACINSLNTVKRKSFNYPGLVRIDLVHKIGSANKHLDSGYYSEENCDILLNYFSLGVGGLLLTNYLVDLLKNISEVITSFGNNIVVDPSKIGEP